MRTEEIIRNLNYTAKKHENDRVFTGQTHITSMCKDILPKMEKLKSYEDAEEQGLLLRLPCKVGDIVYRIGYCGSYIETCDITGFAECDSIESMTYTVYIDPDEEDGISLSEFGKTVFLTKEEAEQKLAEVKGE